MIRFNGQCPAKAFRGFVVVTQIFAGQRQIKTGLKKIGIGIHGILKTVEGFIQASEGHENRTQIVGCLDMLTINF